MLARVFAIVLFECLCLSAQAKVDRVVIIKVDGLPQRLLEQYAQSKKGGPPPLPNIAKIFGRDGVWLENFYVRGLSLSAPSWSMLDTGNHPEIRGNVQYDRYTLRAWDYLNPFPYYVGYALSKRVDMLGVELMQEQGIRLLMDRFGFEHSYQSPQLYQRGIRWQTMSAGLTNPFKRSPQQVFDEWQTGISFSQSLTQAVERDIMNALRDPQIRYIDFFAPEYDHSAHLTPDPAVSLHVLEELDAFIGRVWQAIQHSPLSSTTAMVLVSDHGMNSQPNIFSQGFNLVDWFASAAGGGHHVLTNRYPMTEFKLKALNPFVNEVVTPSRESRYLTGQANTYPTVMLDLDGNERANIGFRENAFNQLHILLDQIFIRRITGRTRTAAVTAFFEILARNRERWEKQVALQQSFIEERRERIAQAAKLVAGISDKWTSKQKQTGADKDARRVVERLGRWRAEDRADTEYLATLQRLLAIRDGDFDTAKFRIEDVIPRKSFGDLNQVYDLAHYTVGVGDKGLVLAADGSLDGNASFATLNYLELLESLSVRNNVQKGVAPNPIDFVAMNLPVERVKAILHEPELDGVIWLHKSRDRQALIVTRHRKSDYASDMEIRYVPVADLQQEASGELHWRQGNWDAGYPLEIFEDPALSVKGDRAQWLGQWHGEHDWLLAVHRTRHSNGVIGLAEQMLLPLDAAPDVQQRRERLETDLLVLASDHWNFNVRGFNPGGNHGSFLRESTHSVLMFAGGPQTGMPHGLRVTAPYDSLNFVPTILKLMNMPEPDLPGQPIEEVFPVNMAILK